MQDEGDLYAVDKFSVGQRLRAILAASTIGWIILALVAFGVWMIFHHA